MSNSNENIFDELKNKISGEIYTDKIRRYMHSTDGSIFRVEPACIVYPKNRQDVVEIVKFANNYQLSIHSRGAGSGLCGAAIGRGIVIDFCKYMNKFEGFEKINDNEGTFTCEPGYRYGELEAFLKGSSMWFPAAPSSGEYATFGGMYGTNAGGGYSVKYGNVSDYIVDAEIVFHDGHIDTLSNIANTKIEDLNPELKELYDILKENQDIINNGYPPIKCNVSGYELRGAYSASSLKLHKLFGGSEGTLGVITKLTFRVIRKKPYNALVIAYFDNKTNSSKAAQVGLKYEPAGIEIMDKSLLSLAVTHEPSLEGKLPTDVDNVLMFEFEGESVEEVSRYCQDTVDEIKAKHYTTQAFIAVSDEEKASYWAVRKAAVPILYLLKGKKKILALVEDAAVPTEKLVEYFDGLYEIFSRHKVEFVSYGHIAKGLLHNRPLLDLKDPYDINLLQVLADEVFELVHKLNGTISGEHGDGRIRSCYINRQYNTELYSLFLRVKSILDPDDLFNPEIKVTNDPAQMTKHLRYGADYGASDKAIQKQLVWEEDFILEAEKCHGCSKCTTVTAATRMCPVYKALRDEAAAPKAKANILRGLLSNVIDSEAMYQEAFQHVINHCVNCGSCSRECPSKVNIPKLALEAKSRYAEKFGVSLDAKLVTNFETAGRLTHKISPVVSALMAPKFMRNILQLTTGLASDRKFVKFASKSLYDRINKTEGNGEKVVMYFAGCYASFIKPEIGESTINVLKKLGYKVVTPAQHCCGIPHLSKGLAKDARMQIKKNLKEWGSLIDQVDYIVSACSSCTLSLTKEWLYYQNDEITQKVRDKTVFIMDLVEKHLKDVELVSNDISLGYHTPCHTKLLKNPAGTLNVLKQLPGVKVEDLKSGCCGMAGSWGMAAKNYDLSVKIGKPMVDKLMSSTCSTGTTECPTCSMQMEHLGDKNVMHPIEVVDKCIK